MYAALATTVLVLHFCYLAYVVLGGFLVWRWPKTFWPHLAAATWGLAVVTLRLTCPLTVAENWARRRAGQSVSDRGFIDTYIENVLYPPRYAHLMQVLVGVLVVGCYAVAFAKYRHRRAGRKMSEPPATV
ncbi:DUF2784 domain-containing protein [Dactylosporangium sp. NPDC048998]|uniref:DUF2784 domain-containing protein n=1 Tax=Dactylosporangium sp. NPDC048998 TaxID=3363976 RepID=UPI00371C7EFB